MFAWAVIDKCRCGGYNIRLLVLYTQQCDVIWCNNMIMWCDHLDSLFQCQQYIQSFSGVELITVDALIDIPQLLSPDGVWSVHLCHLAIIGNPVLGSCRLLQQYCYYYILYTLNAYTNMYNRVTHLLCMYNLVTITVELVNRETWK